MKLFHFALCGLVFLAGCGFTPKLGLINRTKYDIAVLAIRDSRTGRTSSERDIQTVSIAPFEHGPHTITLCSFDLYVMYKSGLYAFCDIHAPWTGDMTLPPIINGRLLWTKYWHMDVSDENGRPRLSYLVRGVEMALKPVSEHEFMINDADCGRHLLKKTMPPFEDVSDKLDDILR